MQPGVGPETIEHGHFAWSPLPGRPVVRWPNGARLAVCFTICLEYYDAEPPAGSEQAGAIASLVGARPSPDMVTLGHREYGHRVGIFRLFDAFRRNGVRPMLAIDARSAEEYPFIVEQARGIGCEFVAHGISVTQIITDALSEERETGYIRESLDRLERALGERPRGWFSPERSESRRTPELLAAAGLGFVLDWSNDEQPYPMADSAGGLLAIPASLDLDDTYSLLRRGVSLASYGAMIRDTVDQLLLDGASTGRLLVITVHPWVTGQPFRIGYLERALEEIAARVGIWHATGLEVADWFGSRSAADRSAEG